MSDMKLNSFFGKIFKKGIFFVINFAKGGGKVMGICNGFQILVETGLLPGVLLRNKYLEFICKN